MTLMLYAKFEKKRLDRFSFLWGYILFVCSFLKRLEFLLIYVILAYISKERIYNNDESKGTKYHDQSDENQNIYGTNTLNLKLNYLGFMKTGLKQRKVLINKRLR